MLRRFKVAKNSGRIFSFVLLIIVFQWLVSFSSVASPAELQSKLIAFTSSNPDLLSLDRLLDGSGGGVDIPVGAEFIKLGLSFDPPIGADKIVVTLCSGKFIDGVEFFTFPDFRRTYAEGGSLAVVARLKGASSSIRSLALNFRHNQGFCLKKISFFDSSGKSIAVETEAALKVASSSQPKLLKAESEINENRDEVKKQFNQSGLAEVLDQELTYRSESNSEKSIFRFRSDGTFFIFGPNYDDKTAGRFTALGKFQVERVAKNDSSTKSNSESKLNSSPTIEAQSKTKSKSDLGAVRMFNLKALSSSAKKNMNKILIKLRGQRLVTPEPWDGFLCGALCGGRGLASANSVIDVNAIIAIEKTNSGFFIRNRTDESKKSLPFSDIHVRASSL